MYTLIYTQLYDINALEINAKNFVRTESYVTSTSIYVVTSGAVTSLECASYVISDEHIAFKHNDATSECEIFVRRERLCFVLSGDVITDAFVRQDLGNCEYQCKHIHEHFTRY